MAAILEIRDGSPHWWNSTDIWVVPGSDPSGNPGQPVAGSPAYLWARVRNSGSGSVSGAQVKFYWSNPATGVLRSNSTFVGSAFVDLDRGEVQEVLCLVPWIPTVVNDGHECIVAEVIHGEDPLPSPLPDEFDPPTYHQIAQRNLTVLAMTTSMMVMAVQVAAVARKSRTLDLQLEVGGKLAPKALSTLGLHKCKLAADTSLRCQLSLDRGCSEDPQGKPKTKLQIKLEPGTARAVYLQVVPEKMKPRTYLPVSVIAREGKRVVGGITYVAVLAEGV